MLRIAVLLLLLANVGYYAWSQGLLRSAGLAPQEQSEPERLARQLHPEALRVLNGSEARKATEPAPAAPASTPAPAPAPAPAECLQAGPFDERQAEALRKAAAPLPEASWTLDATVTPSRWMIYMGRFADAEALDKKRTELRARDVPYDRPGAAFEPGLSLGRFATEEAANQGLADLGKRGVRTARVVVERTESKAYTLRLPAVDSALKPRLDALRPALADKPLRACN